jgi:calcineurin-like phosphoesterase family protein
MARFYGNNMSNIFLCSDHHFGHESMMKFTRNDGSPLRVFQDATHMNEYMIMQHNRVVGPKDKVYFLGDLAMSKKLLPIIHRMNGEKILIRGNHDTEPANVYMQYFKDVRGCHALEGMLLTHIPIHPESLARWRINVHGHLHANRVRLENGHIDERYQCVCMEQLDDYTPIALEVLKTRIKNLNLPELPKRGIIIA